MNITLNENNSKDALRTFFSKEEKTTWHEDKLKAYLDKNKNQTDSIEGIWGNLAQTYKFGIVRDSLNQNEFIGFFVKADGAVWIPQQVKFRIKKTDEIYKFTSFLARDHSPYPAQLSLNKDTMDLKEIGKFYKNDLPEKSPHSPNSPQFIKLDDKTSLLTIPSFAFELKNETDSLIIKNTSFLQDTEHLIIDVRNNSGGAANAFGGILPYLYTNPILTESAKVLATDDNIKDGYERIFNLVSGDTKESYRKKIIELKAHRGELYLLYPTDTIKYTSQLKKPLRVSILMNKKSVSSAELFILQAQQSTKVKLYGTNTAGSVNYLERVETQMPCNFFTLIYPPARLIRADKEKANVGIRPDVAIPANVTDWIDFVKKYKHN